MSSPDVRVVAVRVLATLLEGGGSLSRLLPAASAGVAPADRALLQSLCFDLARWMPRLEALLEPLLDKPLRRKDRDVHLLLLLGLLQLTARRMPGHAAVDTAVSAAGRLRKPWARALVNGVLRNFQRREAELTGQLDTAASLACPVWLLERLQHDWPAHWQALAAAGNCQAPMVLRVNRRVCSVARWLDQAAAAGIEAQAVAGLPCAVQLAQPLAVEALPGFADGVVSVQDAAAQRAALILQAWREQAAPGGTRPARLLDACAAPGGKTAHALETRLPSTAASGAGRPDLSIGSDCWDEVTALDIDPERLGRVQQTLERLSLQGRARLLASDAGEPADWWDSQAFDAVLLDAPCSGSGVIRRHPDIKLLRRDDDIDKLVARQAHLLDALWPVLARGGCLLYATCSIFKAENEDQIEHFLARHPDAVLYDPASLEPLSDAAAGAAAAWGEQRPTGRQIFPGTDGMDGFFYALLGKPA